MSSSTSTASRAGTAKRAAPLAELLEARQFLTAVPSPLQSVDVGTPAGGSASYDQPTHEFTLVGAGYDIFGAADAFHYVYQPLTGNGSVVVRVDSDSANGGLSLAGLDIRSSLSPTAANLWVATRDTGRVFVDDRPTDDAIGISAVPPQDPVSLPVYLKITRSGNFITALSSTDGTNYTALLTETIDLPATALVGMATSSQNAPTMLTTATFGGFEVTPTSAPTATLISAPSIAASTTPPYTFAVAYSDNGAIDPFTIGDNNLIVTGPGGFSQPATLASSAVTAAANVVAAYNIDPLPTTPGTYTITSVPNSVANVAGVPLPDNTVVGTFTVTGSAAPATASITGGVIFADGTILSGRTVFLDTNDNGMLDVGEPTAVSTGTSAFTFHNLAAGSYKAVEIPTAGQQVLEPLSGSESVAVADGQSATIPNFVDIAADTPAATTNLQMSFNSVPATARLGKHSKISVTVTNAGATLVKKRVRITVVASPNGAIADKADAVRFVNVNLKPKSSQNFTFPVKYKKTLGAGTYELIAAVDPDGVVPESSKLDNTAVSSAVTVTA